MSQEESLRKETSRCRCWNKRFENYLLKFGFEESHADPCMFIQSTGNSKLIIVLYVDNGLVAANKTEDLSIFISELKAEFKITSKRADYFLGLEIERKDGCIKKSLCKEDFRKVQ